MNPGLRYNPLSAPDATIRLLKLHPLPGGTSTSAADIATLSCDIEEHPRENCPPYTALSYVWGDPGHSNEFIVANDTTIQISQTVGDALRRLRSQNKYRWVWVDQLCINQQDEVEKSHQVHQMHRIYSAAAKVVAWLGPADEDTNLIFNLMEETGLRIMRDDCEGVMKLYSGAGKDGSVDLAAAARAFHRFCGRSYWTRIWIIQEFAVARRVTVVCGDHMVDAEVLSAALDEYLIYLPSMSTQPAEDIEKLKRKLALVYTTSLSSYVHNLLGRRFRYQAARTGASTNFDSLLKVVATSLALETDYNWVYSSDPRDRIFALLNLAGDKDHFTAFPDYSMTVEEVYKEVARRILDKGCIDVLMYCQVPRKIDSLPSWVPDWSMEIRHPNSHPIWSTPFQASGSETSRPKFPSDDVLELQGIYVDRIKEIGRTWNPNWLQPINKEEMKAYLKSIRDFCDRSPRIRVGDELADTARIAILDAPSWYDWPPSSRSGSECIEGYEALMQTLDTPSPQKSGQDGENQSTTLDPWYEDEFTRQHTRRSFLTSSGYVGVGPLHAQVGDEVCVFLGGKTAYLVRSREGGFHSLVGEAYVHGIMYGELVKGGDYQTKIYRLD
ncbi:hypothetical protein jhhlp_007472 [Lomentospora prolificans]|uniref:Heterokaryon incompatibility domain-containing protein n=1 Tax=Lomentospora prolificans TaxID=41688 RepID=A0A2N3N155_9PEZI|nr:hypothetical protein jhhlp_007472 [Lomentospora prolificans]